MGQGVWASGDPNLTSVQCAQALLSGDTQTDATAFYDRVWAAIRDKYRSEVCGERKGSGSDPKPSQIPPPVLAAPPWRPTLPDVWIHVPQP